MCLLEEATLWRVAPLSAVRWQTLFHTRVREISQGKAGLIGTGAVFNSMRNANVAFSGLIRCRLSGVKMALRRVEGIREGMLRWQPMGIAGQLLSGAPAGLIVKSSLLSSCGFHNRSGGFHFPFVP